MLSVKYIDSEDMKKMCNISLIIFNIDYILKHFEYPGLDEI